MNSRGVRPAGKNKPAPRRLNTGNTQGFSNRDKVDYVQSAKVDLASKTTADDPRMRYTKYRHDKSTKVLSSPQDSRIQSRGLSQGSGRGGGYGSGGSYGSGGGYGGSPGGYGYDDTRGDTPGAPGTPGTPTPRNLKATSAAEYRQRQRMTKPKSNLPARIFATLFILVLLIGGGVALYVSPLFVIKDVQVEGAQHLTSQSLTQLAAIPQDSTLLRADFTGIQNRLEQSIWVESAQVHRQFPNTLVITITERQIAAICDIPASTGSTATQYWLLSRDGIWLGSYNAQQLQQAQAATQSVQGGEGAAATQPPTTPAGAADGTQDNPGADTTADAQGAEGAQGADAQGTDGSSEAPAAAGTGDATADAAAAGATGAGDATADVATGDVGTAGGGVAADAGAAAQNPQDNPTTDTASSVLTDAYVEPSELAGLLHIKDVSRNANPQIGQSVTDEGVLNALAIIKGFSPQMLALVQNISAPDKVKTMLTLTNNVGVAFGAAEDIQAKESVILALLDEHKDTLTYINVRVADRATYRAAE